jgi:hypothetical protein
VSAPLERRPMSARKPRRNFKHGAYVNTSPKQTLTKLSHEAMALRLRSVQRLEAAIFKAMTWLSEADRPAVRSWAELEIITSNVFTNLMGEGILQKDGSGNPRQLLTVYRQLKLTQLAFEKELLMTPASRAMALGKDGGTPLDLVAHFAKTVTNEDEADGNQK